MNRSNLSQLIVVAFAAFSVTTSFAADGTPEINTTPMEMAAINCRTRVLIDTASDAEKGNLQKRYELCVLASASKEAFNLTEKAPAPSEIQRISQDAEANCNVAVAISGLPEGSPEAKGKLRSCYLDQVNKKLSSLE